MARTCPKRHPRCKAEGNVRCTGSSKTFAPISMGKLKAQCFRGPRKRCSFAAINAYVKCRRKQGQPATSNQPIVFKLELWDNLCQERCVHNTFPCKAGASSEGLDGQVTRNASRAGHHGTPGTSSITDIFVYVSRHRIATQW